MTEVIIDVREKDEFAAEHVENSINIPLSQFSVSAPGVFNQLKDRKIVLMCRSGARAQQAQSIAQGLGFNDAHDYAVYPGGLMAWSKSGNPVVASTAKAPLPLIRQVQLIIGVAIIVLGAMGAFVHSGFSLAAAAMGMGVFIAGATGFCALANVVARLPWNRGDVIARKQMCQMSTGSTSC